MRYEIRVEGLMVETTLREAFPELDGVFVPNQTILFGHVTDDAHLFGLLNRFQALGLRVTEMRRLPE
ncbi:hypothetical protein DN069_01990 [Streptacidiphilus pinicola]|uniref:Uncharacterized protein n=1 Tax=Streptacidiphilus pinicola TaxID=2219663 RepID=A0A2X0JI05_9ACTN|nr:hypothetical protein [Streptacidiphilus pinicola]RAG87318.1 hypothetical protein DN069_01990 [Streptacidiphilus pinicola]